MKIMIVNSKIKQKTQNNFGSDQKPSSWIHSLLSCYIYCMRKYPIYVTGAQGKTPNTLCITWESNWKNLWQTTYNSNYTQQCSKLLQWKMYIECKYALQLAICTRNIELFKL